MIRIVKLSGKYYGIKLPDDYQEAMMEIEEFVNQGTPVIVVESIADLKRFDIYDDINIIEPED